MQLTISEIREKIFSLGEKINAPTSYLILPDKPSANGSPHIELIDGNYHYVTTERGYEFGRKITSNPDEVAYWVLKSAILDMAIKYELNNRVINSDSRRLIFKKEMELMQILDPSWANSLREEIEQTLEESPYDDLSDERVALCKKLMSNGIPAEKAYEKACETFPLPV